MRILGIETSCDETAAAVVDDGAEVRSNVVASQVAEHAPWGGVVPEIASRRHLEEIGPVVARALAEAGVSLAGIDGVAVTRGPGLIGSLLVGLQFAKALAFACRLPLVGVNHIEAHIAALGLEHRSIEYPAVALVVSGGHSALYLQRSPASFRLLGQTRDDAVGEAYDKVAKLLGLGYPGGPILDRLAREHGPAQRRLSRPRMSDGSLDLSFSGLKSAVGREIRERGGAHGVDPGEVAAAFQEAAVGTLTDRLAAAVDDWRPRSILLGGGVACNSALRAAAAEVGRERSTAVHLPSPRYATDNAAMVAALGHRLLAAGVRHGFEVDADPALRPGDGSSLGAPPDLAAERAFERQVG